MQLLLARRCFTSTPSVPMVGRHWSLVHVVKRLSRFGRHAWGSHLPEHIGGHDPRRRVNLIGRWEVQPELVTANQGCSPSLLMIV
jgi:hypothetical protein